MLKDFVVSILEKNLGFAPTKSQLTAFNSLGEFICSHTSQIYILQGYAGTGKTSVISSIVQSLEILKLKTVLLAPTGRAAKVLSSYSHHKATTIHKRIYRMKSIAGNQFSRDKNLYVNTIFIIDEASMISDSANDNTVFGSGRLLDDIIDYVQEGKNCRLIMVGDSAQLPPIGYNYSPALDMDTIAKHYDTEVLHATLTDVVRQANKSGILYNATSLRKLILNNRDVMPQITTKNYPDVVRLSGADLIDTLQSSFDKIGLEETIIITRSNKRANKYNEGIRRAVLWREEEISIGDRLMVVKNNYFGLDEFEEIDFIANGDMARITRIGKYENLHDLTFVNVRLKLEDYENVELDTKIIINTLQAETPALSVEQNKAFYLSVSEDYAELKTKKERYQKVKTDPYFNALQVKFGYAITGHKAQGGQWDHVYVDHGYLPEDTLQIDTLRWLYTAITRARKTIYLVNFKEEFFGKTEK